MYIHVYSDLICRSAFIGNRQLDHVFARFVARARELDEEV